MKPRPRPMVKMSDEKVVETLDAMHAAPTVEAMARTVSHLSQDELRYLFNVVRPHERLRPDISQRNAAESVALAVNVDARKPLEDPRSRSRGFASIEPIV